MWKAWSEASLAEAADRSSLAINPIIYAEISVAYASIEEVDAAFPLSTFLRLDLPYAAGFLAGRAYRGYRRRGGIRRSPLPDFYIGAHAAISGFDLLTRDIARYATYFPTVKLIAP